MSDIEMMDAAPLHEDPEASDEGEGDDLGADLRDSSEEEATDEEEEQNVKAGFIVDDDEEEPELSDDEERSHKKRRKRRRKARISLEDDDLELLAENTGRKVASRSDFSRLRRGRASPTADAHPPTSSRDILAAELSDDGSQRDVMEGIFEEDDNESFIDDEDSEEDLGAMGEEELAQKRRERKQDAQRRKKAMDARPELAGIDAGAWDEIYDVFGAGDDYDWALDEDEAHSDHEGAPKEMRYQDVFEPSEIAARFLTADDDVIRATDVPERMQLSTSSLSPQATLGPGIEQSKFTTEEISTAAEWVSQRLSSKIRDNFFRPTGEHHDLLQQLIEAITSVLDYVLNQKLEVPYIWAHRRDHISVFEPSRRVLLLDRDELWRIASLAPRYRALYNRKKTLEVTYERMRVNDLYYEIDIASNLTSVDAVTDAMEWLSLKHKKAFQDSIELEDDGETQRQKKPSRISPYDLAKASVASQLADSFGIATTAIVKNIVLDQKQHFIEDPSSQPDIFAEGFVSDRPGEAHTASEALHTARMIIATELGKDPQLRQLTRDRFKQGAVVTVRPTEKGVNKIDDQHPYASFKYLQRKPVQNMLNDAQWLHILAAEADHLVTVEVGLALKESEEFREFLSRAFRSDGFSDVSGMWNKQRTMIIDEVIEKHLVPVGVKHVREWLRDEVEEQLASRCSTELERRIDVAPFRPKEFAKGDVPSVLAISWGKGDPQRDAIFAVLMDEAGHIREHTKFDNLMDPDARSDFADLITRRKPDVVAVSGFSILSVKLWERVREVIGYEEHHDSSGQEPKSDPNGADAVGGASSSASKPTKDLVPVIWVPDQVARIFQHSQRANDEFGSLPIIGRYCAGLARYVQSPLNEYAALGADIAAVSFHEDQQLLPTEKLLSALERAMVSVVNEVGVDINKAVTDPYYRHHLPFIAGLGPRKAQAILKRIGTLGGTVLNREHFILHEIMTVQIFMNAAGFLKIVQDDMYEDTKVNSRGGYEATRKQDPLDSTRIHPEDYELARKMASGALDLDEEDFANLHPSAPVYQLMHDDKIQSHLNALGLDEFADSLWNSNMEKKRHTLDVIHDELMSPFGENRPDFEPMTDWEVITMLTGETRKTLVPGRVLTVTVARVRKDQVDVRLDSGLDGFVTKDYLTATGADPNQVVKIRQSLQSVIVAVEILKGPKVRVRLASRGDAITQADHERPKKFDDHYDHAAARAAQEIQERKQRSEANRTRRIIKHPSFKNFNMKEAESWLAPLQHGEAVIRPSSKGHDHLAVTWKVADGVFQHIDVVEPNAEGGPNASGQNFIIDNQYYYSDLDDLLVNHVKAMSRKVDDLIASEKYKGGNDQDLDNWLTNFVKMNPNRSSYAFGLNRQKPGFFNLSFLANINSPLTTWQVKVTPTSYRLGDVEVGSVPDLCDAFKRKHQKDLKTLANGGKTPYGAGRMTPGRTTQYGKTPNAYQSGIAPGKTPNPYQPKTPAYMVGKTPNPHAPPPMAPPVGVTAAMSGLSMGGIPMQNMVGMGPPPPVPPPMGGQVPMGMNPERWRQIQAQTQAMRGGQSPAAPSPAWRPPGQY